MDERDRQIEMVARSSQDNAVGVSENAAALRQLEQRIRSLEAKSGRLNDLKKRLGKVAAAFDSLFQTADGKIAKAQSTADTALKTAILLQGRQEGRAAAAKEITGQFQVVHGHTQEQLKDERETRKALLKALLLVLGFLGSLAGLAKLAFEMFGGEG